MANERTKGGGDLRLSLVIPCYNEAEGLPSLVTRCKEVVAAAPGIEIILVNNGSTDRSAEVLEAEIQGVQGLRGVTVPVNQGYGFGVLSGVRTATGDIIAWTHADLQTDPMDAVRGLEWFKEAAQPERLFVKGRRSGRPAFDRVFTFGMSLYESVLFGLAISDINAVPTMFHRSFFADWTFEGWENPPYDFSLDLFAYVTAKQRGLTVRRLGVNFGVRRHGQSSWNANNLKSKQKFIKRTLDYSARLKRQLAITPVKRLP